MDILLKATLDSFGSVALPLKACPANQLVRLNPTNPSSSPSQAGTSKQTMGHTWSALMKRACWTSLEKPENRAPDPGEDEDCRGWELIIPDFILTLPTNVKRTAFWQEKDACMWGMIKSCGSSG